MAGYKLQSKTNNGTTVDIPLAATYDGEGNEIRKYYVTNNDFLREINEITKTYSGSFDASRWIGVSAPYSITIPNSTHGLGSSVKVDYFNNGNDEFEWKKDASGNITIYSNVKVAIMVYLK